MPADIPTRPLIEQIDAIIEANGSAPQAMKDTLMFSVVKSIVLGINEMQQELNKIAEMKTDIKELQERSIVNWCIKHPTVAVFIIALIGMLLFSHYGTVLLDYIGIKLPAIP